jgi:hypothetical protein
MPSHGRSANVGNAQAVSVTYALGNGSGANAGLASNYALASQSLTGDITPRALSITG